MLDIGGWEFLVVAFVLIMVVGPKELPRMLRSFTQFSRSMRKMAREFTDGMNQIANDAEVADLKKAMNEAKGSSRSGTRNTSTSSCSCSCRSHGRRPRRCVQALQRRRPPLCTG